MCALGTKREKRIQVVLRLLCLISYMTWFQFQASVEQKPGSRSHTLMNKNAEMQSFLDTVILPHY